MDSIRTAPLDFMQIFPLSFFLGRCVLYYILSNSLYIVFFLSHFCFRWVILQSFEFSCLTVFAYYHHVVWFHCFLFGYYSDIARYSTTGNVFRLFNPQIGQHHLQRNKTINLCNADLLAIPYPRIEQISYLLLTETLEWPRRNKTPK